MICEGTRMVEEERRKNYSEQQVEDLAGKVVSATDKIVFVTRYSRDMDRFRSFYNVAKRIDRILFDQYCRSAIDRLLSVDRSDDD